MQRVKITISLYIVLVIIAVFIFMPPVPRLPFSAFAALVVVDFVDFSRHIRDTCSKYNSISIRLPVWHMLFISI